MKKLLSLMGVVALGSSALASTALTNVPNMSQKVNEQSTTFTNASEFNKQWAKVSDEFIAKDESNEQQLREVIQSAVVIEDNHYYLDADQLAPFKNEKIYDFLTHELFEENLKVMVGDEVNPMANTSFDNELGLASNFTIFKGKVWVVVKWSWGLYWELHFDREATETIISIINGVNLLINLSKFIPHIAPFAAPVALFLISIKGVLKMAASFDNGNGAYLSIWGIIPTGITAK